MLLVFIVVVVRIFGCMGEKSNELVWFGLVDGVKRREDVNRENGIWKERKEWVSSSLFLLQNGDFIKFYEEVPRL